MAEAISRYLQEDHQRIDDALRRATAGAVIQGDAYSEFRGALLRHIGMEEKILLPAARAANGGKEIQHVQQLHLDHGALAALLVPTPTAAIVGAIREILKIHNVIEEGAGGVYSQCEELLGSGAEAVHQQLRAAPAVAMAPHVDNATAMNSLRAALARAGYSIEL